MRFSGPRCAHRVDCPSGLSSADVGPFAASVAPQVESLRPAASDDAATTLHHLALADHDAVRAQLLRRPR